MPAPAIQSSPLGHQPGAPWPLREAAPFLAISVRHLHRLADANLVRTIRLGRRRLIPDVEVMRLASEGI